MRKVRSESRSWQLTSAHLGLQVLARGKLHTLGRFDLQLLLGLGIDAHSSFPFRDLERSKAYQLHSFVALEPEANATDDCVHAALRLRPTGTVTQGLEHCLDEIAFVHGPKREMKKEQQRQVRATCSCLAVCYTGGWEEVNGIAPGAAKRSQHPSRTALPGTGRVPPLFMNLTRASLLFEAAAGRGLEVALHVARRY
jgi:hypothetical protein